MEDSEVLCDDEDGSVVLKSESIKVIPSCNVVGGSCVVVGSSPPRISSS